MSSPHPAPGLPMSCLVQFAKAQAEQGCFPKGLWLSIEVS